MFRLDKFDTLYVFWSFLFHLALIAHFAVRKTYLDFIFRHGWIFYLLSIPSAAVSVILLRGGKPLSFWLPGFLFLVWAVFGFVVEYLLGIEWRTPPNWPVLIPYVLLYLGTVMFYWWPVAQLVRPLWFIYAAFFALETYLNVTSH